MTAAVVGDLLTGALCVALLALGGCLLLGLL